MYGLRTIEWRRKGFYCRGLGISKGIGSPVLSIAEEKSSDVRRFGWPGHMNLEPGVCIYHKVVEPWFLSETLPFVISSVISLLVLLKAFQI